MANTVQEVFMNDWENMSDAEQQAYLDVAINDNPIASQVSSPD